MHVHTRMPLPGGPHLAHAQGKGVGVAQELGLAVELWRQLLHVCGSEALGVGVGGVAFKALPSALGSAWQPKSHPFLHSCPPHTQVTQPLRR